MSKGEKLNGRKVHFRFSDEQGWMLHHICLVILPTFGYEGNIWRKSHFRISDTQDRCSNTFSPWASVRFSDVREEWTKGHFRISDEQHRCRPTSARVPSDFRICGQNKNNGGRGHFRISDEQRGMQHHFCLAFHPIFEYEANMGNREHFRFSDEQRWRLLQYHTSAWASVRFSDMRRKIWTGRGVISEFRMKNNCCTTSTWVLPSDFRIRCQMGEGSFPIFGWDGWMYQFLFLANFGYEPKMDEKSFPDSDGQQCLTTSLWVFFRFSDMRPKWTRGHFRFSDEQDRSRTISAWASIRFSDGQHGKREFPIFGPAT
jgi:hypothetical protein